MFRLIGMGARQRTSVARSKLSRYRWRIGPGLFQRLGSIACSVRHDFFVRRHAILHCLRVFLTLEQGQVLRHFVNSLSERL